MKIMLEGDREIEVGDVVAMADGNFFLPEDITFVVLRVGGISATITALNTERKGLQYVLAADLLQRVG